MGRVPSEASLKTSGFILFRGKIMAGGTKKQTGFIAQTTVTGWPLSADKTFPTKGFTFRLMTFGILFGTELSNAIILHRLHFSGA